MHFEQIRFTHAFPSTEPQIRPCRIPLSSISWPDPNKPDERETGDAALCRDPGLIHGYAPAFQIDWKKEWSAANKRFGWPILDRELRVRTAMDPIKRRSKAEQLFGYEMVRPGGATWLAQVDLSRLHGHKGKVAAQLKALLKQGLRGLGKTKASADVDSDCSFAPKLESNAEAQHGLWVVVLQTPALLCSPEALRGAHTTDALRMAYDMVWQEMSGNQLKLVRLFAAQEMAGGDYLHNRFQNDKPYYPFVLTSAGSVFVLQPAADVQEKHAEEKVRSWLTQGLPLPDWVEKKYGDGKSPLWQRCPFLPEHGFGEIAVNLSCHRVPEGYRAV